MVVPEWQAHVKVLVRRRRFGSKNFEKSVLYSMATTSESVQTGSKTPFKRQADVISGILRTNPIINDDEKTSMRETIGVLTWLNQLQLHMADGGKEIPENIYNQIFEGRKPQKIVAVKPQ